MTDQNTFMEIVQNVAEIVRTAEVPMTENEILEYFSDMDLDENQKKLVLEYIVTAKEREEETVEEEERQAQDVTVDEADGESKSKVFQMYLDELSGLPSVGVAERNKLYQRLALGESDAIGLISTAWLKRVLTIAEKYVEPRLNVEDLVQEGNMALFMKLQTMLGQGQMENTDEVLTNAVEEGILSYCSEIVGAREQENTLVGKISLVYEAKKMLAMENGKEPTVEELSEYTKMSMEELKEIEDFWKE